MILEEIKEKIFIKNLRNNKTKFYLGNIYRCLFAFRIMLTKCCTCLTAQVKMAYSAFII